jgi:hypothetical protein
MPRTHRRRRACRASFFHGNGAAVVAVDHGESPLLQQLHIAVLVRVHVRQTDHMEAVVTFTASPASGLALLHQNAGDVEDAASGEILRRSTGYRLRAFRLSAKLGGRRIPDQNDDGAQTGTMRG